MSSEVCPFCGKSFKRLKSHLPHCKAAKSSKTTTSPRHEETKTSSSSSSSSLPPNSNQTQRSATTEGKEQAAMTLKKPSSVKKTKMKLSEQIKMAAEMSSPTSVPSSASKSKKKVPTWSQIDEELTGNHSEKVRSSLNAKPEMANSSSTENNREIIHEIGADIERQTLNRTEEQRTKPTDGMKDVDSSQTVSKTKEVKGILTKKSSSNKGKVSKENVWSGGEENQRSLAENQRSLAENQRSLPENQRSLAENQRSLPENQRSLAENQRSLPENQRSLPENQRSLRENQRSLAENQRSLAENQRSLPENQRSLAENQRSLAENQRSLAENQRSLPENQRSLREIDALTSKQEATVTLHDVRAALGRTRQNGRRKENPVVEDPVKESETKSVALLREAPSQLMALTAERSGRFLSELSKAESTDCNFSQRAELLKDGLRMDGHSRGLAALPSPATAFLQAEVSSEAFGKDAAAIFKANLQEAEREMEAETRRDVRKPDERSVRGALSQQRLGQVMLRELPDWLVSRSPRRPRDAFQLLQRGWQWYYRRYIDVRKGGVGGVAMLLAGYCVLSYVWTFPRLKRERWRKYH